MSSSNGHHYVFGEFEVDPANRVFLRDGTVVPLTGKVFDVLLAFAENPGRLLEKDELIKTVWQENFVEEGNLARNVSTLRKALGDNGKRHKYIVTVPGHGYRFLPDVRQTKSAQGAQTSENFALANVRSGPGSRAWLITIGVFVLTAFVALLLLGGPSDLNNTTQINFENIQQTKLTQDGDVISPVISRDGQYLGYVCKRTGKNGICVRQIATGSVLQAVPGSNDSRNWGVMVSPDDRFVYYISRDDKVDRGILYRVPLFGGTPKKLTENVNGFSVSPDGSKIVLFRSSVDTQSASIVVADNEGGNETIVLSAELETVVYSLDWSPDGQNILYSINRQTANGEDRYVAEIPAAGGTEKRIPNPTGSKIGSIRWMPNKTGFICNILDEATNSLQLYYLTYPDGGLRRLTNDVNGFDGFSMTADGRSIVAGRSYDDRQIWIEKSKDPLASKPITSDTERHFDTVAWAGNEYLVYDEDENSGYRVRNIWRMYPDGSGRQQLTIGSGYNAQPTVSPDGKSIVFISHRSGKSELWRMNIDGKDLVQLTNIKYNVSSPRFSEFGKALFFSAWVDGTYQVWRISAEGGEAKPVLKDVDVRDWAVSPDGAQIAFAYFDHGATQLQNRLRAFDGSSSDRVLDFLPESWMAWSNDGRSLYFNEKNDESMNVWRRDIVGAFPVQVTHFANQRIYDCSLAPDGIHNACIRQEITFDAVMFRL